MSCVHSLGAALRLVCLLQRPLDAVQEKGVLLDALPLEVEDCSYTDWRKIFIRFYIKHSFWYLLF